MEEMDAAHLDVNACCHFCRVSRHRKRKTALNFLRCSTCQNAYCEPCSTTYLNLDFVAISSGTQPLVCQVCQKICCCNFEVCSRDHRHCFTYRRGIKRQLQRAQSKQNELPEETKKRMIESLETDHVNLLLPKRFRIEENSAHSATNQSMDHSVNTPAAPAPPSVPIAGDVPTKRKRGRPPKKKSSNSAKRPRISFSFDDLESDDMSGVVRERHHPSKRRSFSSLLPPPAPVITKTKSPPIFDPFKETMRYFKKHGKQPRPGTIIHPFGVDREEVLQYDYRHFEATMKPIYQ